MHVLNHTEQIFINGLQFWFSHHLFLHFPRNFAYLFNYSFYINQWFTHHGYEIYLVSDSLWIRTLNHIFTETESQTAGRLNYSHDIGTFNIRISICKANEKSHIFTDSLLKLLMQDCLHVLLKLIEYPSEDWINLFFNDFLTFLVFKIILDEICDSIGDVLQPAVLNKVMEMTAHDFLSFHKV